MNGNFNATLSALAPGSTLSVQVGSDAADTLTFGTGTGQISTKVQTDHRAQLFHRYNRRI